MFSPMITTSRRKVFTFCSSDFRRGLCAARVRSFPPSLSLALLVQTIIYGIRSKDSIGRAQPFESGHEQDAHG